MAVPVFNQALQIFYKDKTKFIIPKKGTEDYKKVIAIMNDLKKNKPTTPTKQQKEPKQSKVAKTKPAGTTAEKPLQVSTKGDIKI